MINLWTVCGETGSYVSIALVITEYNGSRWVTLLHSFFVFGNEGNIKMIFMYGISPLL